MHRYHSETHLLSMKLAQILYIDIFHHHSRSDLIGAVCQSAYFRDQTLKMTTYYSNATYKPNTHYNLSKIYHLS